MTTSSRRAIGGILATMWLAAPVRGQEPPPRPRASQFIDASAGLGLPDAIARALDSEPSLRAARTEVDAARGQRQQAGLRPNPSVTFEQRDEPAGTDSQTSIGIEWPLDLFRRPGRVRTAERELEATRLAVTDRERLLAADVRAQYGDVAASIWELAVAEDLVAAAGRQVELVRARVAEGATPPIERDVLDVELRRLEAERVRAAGRVEVAMVQLKRLLGMAPEDPLALKETLEQLVMAGSATPSTSSAPASLAGRADLREAEARVALAEARVDEARREGRVDVTLFGSYMRMDAGFSQRGFNAAGALERVRGRFDYVTGGAMVKLPAFDRNQGQVAAAQAERAGAEARREAVRLAARAGLAAAQARDAHARQTVALYAGGARALARQNLDVVRQTFDLGRATAFDVLSEQRRFLEIEQAYAAALREAWAARADLKRAVGDTR